MTLLIIGNYKIEFASNRITSIRNFVEVDYFFLKFEGNTLLGTHYREHIIESRYQAKTEDVKGVMCATTR